MSNTKKKRMPTMPMRTYKDKWKGWADLLHKDDTFYTYEELKELCKKNNISTQSQYVEFYKKHNKTH